MKRRAKAFLLSTVFASGMLGILSSAFAAEADHTQEDGKPAARQETVSGKDKTAPPQEPAPADTEGGDGLNIKETKDGCFIIGTDNPEGKKGVMAIPRQKVCPVVRLPDADMK